MNTPQTSRDRQSQINRYVHSRLQQALAPVTQHFDDKVSEGFMTQQELDAAYFYCGLKED